MPRLKPPPGFVTLKDATALLNRLGLEVSETMIYKYIQQGRLHRHGPDSRKQKYYSVEEIEALAEAELAFHKKQAKKDIDAMFAKATPDDMEGVYKVAASLFGDTTSAVARKPLVAQCPGRKI